MRNAFLKAYPFGCIMAVVDCYGEFVFRCQAIINIDTDCTQFGGKSSTEQLFVLKSTNAPSASVVEDLSSIPISLHPVKMSEDPVVQHPIPQVDSSVRFRADRSYK